MTGFSQDDRKTHVMLSAAKHLFIVAGMHAYRDPSSRKAHQDDTVRLDDRKACVMLNEMKHLLKIRDAFLKRSFLAKSSSG